MTNMKEAIEVLRELPEERQEAIARAILDYAPHEDGVYHLTDEERREVRAGRAEIERSEIASDEEVRTVYKRIGVLAFGTLDARYYSSRRCMSTCWRAMPRPRTT